MYICMYICIFMIYLFISFLIECGKLVDTVITRKQCKYFTSNFKAPNEKSLCTM